MYRYNNFIDVQDVTRAKEEIKLLDEYEQEGVVNTDDVRAIIDDNYTVVAKRSETTTFKRLKDVLEQLDLYP